MFDAEWLAQTSQIHIGRGTADRCTLSRISTKRLKNMLDELNLQTLALLQWFQQDVTQSYNQICIQNYLQRFSNKWIGRNDWPPGSSDLTKWIYFGG